MSKSKKIKEFVTDFGYDKYIYLGNWGTYPVYQPQYDDDILNKTCNDTFIIIDYKDDIRFGDSSEIALIKSDFWENRHNLKNINGIIDKYKEKYIELYNILESGRNKVKTSIIRTGILASLGIPSFLQNLSALDAGYNYGNSKNFSSGELKYELKKIFFEISYPEYRRKNGDMDFWDLYFYISELLDVELTELDREIIEEVKTDLYLEFYDFRED